MERVYGVCFHENYNMNALSMKELSQALGQVTQNGQEKNGLMLGADTDMDGQLGPMSLSKCRNLEKM